MHDRFCERIETALLRLAGWLQRARNPVDRGATERQIGRLLGRNSRRRRALRDPPHRRHRCPRRFAAGMVDPRLRWGRLRAEWDEWSAYSEGCYVLRTNITDWTPEALWRTHIQLTEAEAAFRIHKSELSIRPIWHQQRRASWCASSPNVLWTTLEQWQSRAGLGNAPRTILQELGAIHSTDIVLPTAVALQRDPRLRCVVRPDRAQAALLDRRRLHLPERLRACASPDAKCSANFAT